MMRAVLLHREEIHLCLRVWSSALKDVTCAEVCAVTDGLVLSVSCSSNLVLSYGESRNKLLSSKRILTWSGLFT